jgi:1-carboxybiuret hydrolase subunit AtzG-like
MASPESDLQRAVRAAAEQAGLPLAPEHVPGVAEHYARLAAQAELLLAFPLEDADEPAPVYTP